MVSVKRLADEAGLQVHGEVVKKGQAEQQDGSLVVGVVQRIDESSVHVSWNGQAPTVVSVDDLAPAPKKVRVRSEPASSQSLVLATAAVKWSPVSNAENSEMLQQLAATTLYQVYVSRSAAHGELHVLPNKDAEASSQGTLAIYAAREFKERALAIIPFGPVEQATHGARPQGAVPLQMVIKPEQEKPTRVNFWVRPKKMPRKLALSQEKAVVVIPFWALASQHQGRPEMPSTALAYRTATINVSSPVGLDKALRPSKSSISMRVVYMTNLVLLQAGDRVCAAESAPSELDSVE